MLTGRPITTARASSFDSASTSAAASSENFLRMMTGARMREGKAAIGDRQPDGLVAEIDPGERSAGSQQRRELFDW